MRHPVPRFAIASALMFSAVACGPLRRGSDRPDAFILFDNQSLNQADVFLVRSAGDVTRIGTVFGGRRETLRVSYNQFAASPTLNIVARIRVTSRAPRTGPITLTPGEAIAVTLPMDEKILSALPAPPPP